MHETREKNAALMWWGIFSGLKCTKKVAIMQQLTSLLYKQTSYKARSGFKTYLK